MRKKFLCVSERAALRSTALMPVIFVKLIVISPNNLDWAAKVSQSDAKKLAISGERKYNKINTCTRRSKSMAISYNKLWKLLVDKKMSKADLRKAAGIAPNTMTRLRRDEEVTLTVLHKICKTLEVDIGDIMEFLPEPEEEKEK